MKQQLFIAQAKRTPIGSFQGSLTSYKGYQLGSLAIGALNAVDVDEVIMGCVLPAAQGQAPARKAALGANLSPHVSTTTVNKVCGSGMKAIMIACDQIALGGAESVIAGGMESMSNAPYLLEKARGGYRIGHGEIIDHLYKDGLEDAYHHNADGSATLMGCFAEATAEKYGLSREDQDQFALKGFEKAQKAIAHGFFKDEIISIETKDTKGNVSCFKEDEPPTRVKPEKFSLLKPAFKSNGTVTAATSSSLADGAAALWIANDKIVNKHSLNPLARVVGYASHAGAPEWFTTAPIGALDKLMQQISWKLEDVDLFEINEAFAVVPMAAMKELKIPSEKMNIHGGACTLGHPIGASGARIVVTLAHALKMNKLKRGIACICIGGGESTAIAIEVV
ncbi:MAG: thiolase family protein [Alphaproteobacteria bacterium]|nr:thiolase family protein [Alphaproteobacteria bacterium]